MKKFAGALLVLAIAFGVSGQATTKIQLWTQEGEGDGSLQFIQKLVNEFTAANPNVAIDIVQKNTEALREDFQMASLAGNAPEFLWTVSDHAGPFVTADLIQPVDSMVKLSDFVESVVMNGKTWAVPINSGNHLMLIYNKKLIKSPPKDTDELLRMGEDLKKAGLIPLVFNQTEPFWLVPWLGGFGGKVFGNDGRTPTLNTQAMVDTLAFLKSLKDKGIIPPESDYNGADALFKEAKAAMIINGDWSLSSYSAMNFGTARIPMVKKTGKWPASYTSGKYFMISKDVSGAKLEAIKGFIKYATSYEKQVELVKDLKRLPGLKKALTDSAITSDPILKGSSDQMAVGTPMPTVVEMRVNWDSMKPEMNKVLAGSTTPAAAAKAMQDAAIAGIKLLNQ